jgi:uncharacterized protein (TIGR04255 family)
MSERMKDPPIFYTVAQVKFGAVLAMDESISSIQKTWRSAYPDFSSSPINQIQLLGSSPTQGQMRTTTLPRWIFKDITGRSGLILTTESLSYQTTEYVTSGHFIDALISALQVVGEAVAPAYIESVGFRTLDAIIPLSGKKLTSYLSPGLHGLWTSLEGTLRHSVTELVLQPNSQTQLISRCNILNGKLGIPFDLFPILFKLQGRAEAIEGIHAVLDNDAVLLDRFKFDIEEARARLRKVKTHISEAFYTAVSKEALAEWRGNHAG